MSSSVDGVLKDRGSKHGPFTTQAYVSQMLKEVAEKSPNFERMEYDQRESILMILHKVSRILVGDPDYDDHWVDIAGYATLISNRLQNQKEKT